MDIVSLFQEIDIDNSGTLSQKEFIEFYMNKFQALEDRRVEMQYRIISNYKQLGEVELRSLQAEKDESELTHQGISKDAKLRVAIVCANNLKENEVSFVRVSHDGQEGETERKLEGSGPIWNDSIVFEVQDKDQPVIVQLISAASNTVLAQEELDLNYYMDMEVQNEERVIRNEQQGEEELIIRVQFLYSRVQMYEQLVRDFENYIGDDFQEMWAIEQWQQNLAAPFMLETVQRFGKNQS